MEAIADTLNACLHLSSRFVHSLRRIALYSQNNKRKLSDNI